MIERQFARIRRSKYPTYWDTIWHHRPEDMHIVLLGLIAEAL